MADREDTKQKASEVLTSPSSSQGESLVDVHRSLPPEMQKYLTEQKDSKTHHDLLRNMATMMPDARADYIRGMMRP